MIKLSSLSYSYPDSVVGALRSITMSIDPGEFVLLSGSSGSGKSTLLRVVNGLVPHFFGGTFSGEALIGNLNTRNSSPTRLASVVGTVFQEPRNRFITTTVEDEIAFGLELAGIPGQEIRGRVAEMIERFTLGPLMDRKLDQLSAGEQQRVAIAAALGRLPKVLLLDEPASQLDPPSSRAVLEWISELREGLGLTTIVAEHRIDRIMHMADRIAFLSDTGSLQAYGTPEDVIPKIPLTPSILRAMEILGIEVNLDEENQQMLMNQINQIKAPTMTLTRAGIKPVLISKHISHNYNGIPALNNVSLDIFPGEIVALVGHNGAGKSTLLRCLMGLISPDSGDVYINGDRVHDRQVSEHAKRVAYVPQWPSALLFADTIAEELQFTLRNHGIEDSPPLDQVDLLKQLGLFKLRERYPRDLSAGQRQRVALASVLVTKPNIILLDEPTLGMDLGAQTSLSQLLKTWRDDGAAILVATHDVEFAAAYADRVVILGKGGVEADGPTSETLFSKPHLRTSLQRLTGMPWPASPEQLEAVQGEINAQH
jgi:energy-coupling factor transport system ATP-binding protein